jgi:hypothetical protein
MIALGRHQAVLRLEVARVEGDEALQELLHGLLVDQSTDVGGESIPLLGKASGNAYLQLFGVILGSCSTDVASVVDFEGMLR